MRKPLFLLALTLLLSTFTPAQAADPVIGPENAATVHEVAHIWRGAIDDMAVSASGSMMAVAANTGVYVYNLKDRSAPVLTLPIETADVRCVAFDSSGSNIAVGTQSGKVYVFSATSGDRRAVIEASDKAINDVLFTSAPFSLLAAGDDHLISVWSMRDFSRLNALSGHSYPVKQLALAGSGKTIISTDYNSIHFWDSGSFFPRSTLDVSGVGPMAFNPTKPLAIALGLGGDLTLDGDLGVTGGDTSVPLDHSLTAIAYSADGRMLATADSNTITLRDPDSGEAIRQMEQGGYVLALAFSPDGSRLYASGNGAIAIWDTASGDRIETIFDQFGNVDSLSFTPDGKLLAVGNYLNPSVTIFDATTLQQVAELHQGVSGEINAATFSLDGKLLATAGSVDDNAITLWDTATFKPVRQLVGHSQEVRGLSFSPDSTALFSVASDVESSSDATPAVGGNTGRLWDVASGKLIREIQPSLGALIWSGLFTPDGTTLVTGSDDDMLRFWNPYTGEKTGEVKLAFTPYDMAINATDTMLFYSATNQTNYLSLNPAAAFTPPVGYVSATSSDGVFSPDGKLAALRIDDNDIRLYDIAANKPITQLKGHTSNINTLVFSPDGTRLVSTALDGTIRFWAAEPSGRPRAPRK